MIERSKVETFLGAVFDRFQEETLASDDYSQRRRDFVFHMVECLDDLTALHHLYTDVSAGARPESDAVVDERSIAGFLMHVVPHLSAAGRLLLEEIPDPFVPKGFARRH